MSLPEAKKVCVVGNNLYLTNDHMFSIPERYTGYFGSNDLLTGRFRDVGWSGMGTSLFALSTDDIVNSENNQAIDIAEIIKYENSYNGDNGYKMNDYSHPDSWMGGVFVTCDAGNAILIAGTHSYAKTWYGFSNGVVYPTDGDEDAIYPDVPDYPHDQRGWWSDDFRTCIILYDVEHAVKVFNNEMKAYDIQPYAFIDLSEYMISKNDETDMQYLGAVAYDMTSNRLYIMELFAGEDKPIVHVFTFEH